MLWICYFLVREKKEEEEEERTDRCDDTDG